PNRPVGILSDGLEVCEGASMSDNSWQPPTGPSEGDDVGPADSRDKPGKRDRSDKRDRSGSPGADPLFGQQPPPSPYRQPPAGQQPGQPPATGSPWGPPPRPGDTLWGGSRAGVW